MHKKGISIQRICTTFILMSPLAVCSEESRAPDREQWSVPQQAQQQCGPKCSCGCLNGGNCTCTPEQRVATYEHPQQPSPYQAAVNYQENNDDYSYYSEACDSCSSCCESDDGVDCCNYVNPDPGLFVYEPGCRGYILLADDPPLFRPLMADPREVDYSVGWRFNDNALTKNVIDVSFADTCQLIRFLNVGPWCGQLQIELEGGVWAVFDPCYESAPLMNADYYVGVPITYAFDRWEFRLRGYHISSHIGDEFLLNHPGFDRRNPSAEYLDFFASYDLTDEIRLYGGIGYTFFQDDSFHIKPWYGAAGAELRLLRLGFYDHDSLLYGCPIYAMYFRFSSEFKNHVDATYILGYEFGKLCGTFRKLRFFMEYHDGYSLEGQFCKFPTNYFSIRASYGY